LALGILKTDFVGYYQIPKGCYVSGTLDDYISRFGTEALQELLGAEYTAYAADTDAAGVPSDATYLTWYNPFVEENSCNGELDKSQGIKEMLIAYIFYYYMRDMGKNLTVNGLVTDVHENSEIFNVYNQEAYALERYNRATETFNAIYRKKNSVGYDKAEYASLM
jgi:hypothetical protein